MCHCVWLVNRRIARSYCCYVQVCTSLYKSVRYIQLHVLVHVYTKSECLAGVLAVDCLRTTLTVPIGES